MRTTTHDRIYPRECDRLGEERGGLIPYRTPDGKAYFVVTSREGLEALGYSESDGYGTYPFAHMILSESFASQQEAHRALHASLVTA